MSLEPGLRRRRVSSLVRESDLAELGVPQKPKLPFLRHWLATTTDPDFLTSWGSRRPSWTVFWPVAGAMMICRWWMELQVNADISFVMKACFAFQLTLVFSRLPTHRLEYDFLQVSFLLVAVHTLFPQDQVLATPMVYYIILTMSLGYIGLHALVLLLWALIFAASLVILQKIPFDGVLAFTAAANVMIALLNARVQLSIAALNLDYKVLYREDQKKKSELESVNEVVQKKKSELERVLDVITDGFCTVDRRTGTISEASCAMRSTWEDENLDGKIFEELLCNQADRGKDAIDVDWQEVKGVLKSQEINEVSDPILVESGTGKVSFNVRITVHAVSEESSIVCVQLVGERRARALWRIAALKTKRTLSLRAASKERKSESTLLERAQSAHNFGRFATLGACIPIARAVTFLPVTFEPIKEAHVVHMIRAACDGAPRFLDTLLFVWSLIQAVGGGSMIVVVPNEIAHNLRVQYLDCHSHQKTGYMMRRLSRNGKGLEIKKDADTIFETLIEFAEHTDSDKWPETHPDEDARGLPKDGGTAFLASGSVHASAVRFSHPPKHYAFASKGTRHAGGIGVAEWLHEGCVGDEKPAGMVFIRSESGSVSIIDPRKIPKVFEVLRGRDTRHTPSQYRRNSEPDFTFGASFSSFASFSSYTSSAGSPQVDDYKILEESAVLRNANESADQDGVDEASSTSDP